MSASKPPRHPLFDPTSTYSRMRKSVRPEYKMRGYFHWQKARAIRLGLSRPERPPQAEEELRSRLRGRGLASGTGGSGGERAPDFQVTDLLDVELRSLLREPRCLRAVPLRGSLVLVREADGTHTVGMQVDDDRSDRIEPGQAVSCRAFLIEPEVLARLQEVVQKTSAVGPDRVLDHAFAAETVSSNMDIARLLCAIPDLDGEVRGCAIRFHRLPIAAEFRFLPAASGAAPGHPRCRWSRGGRDCTGNAQQRLRN